MQTFMPYDDFEACAQVLDYRRLGKQRVETLQILNALTGVSKRWGNHPITRMWEGHEHALALYGMTMCLEWSERGYRDTCYGKILNLVPEADECSPDCYPEWIFNLDFQVSHRAALVFKNPEFYGPLFPHVPPVLDYVWPV